jgi:hypothetical protein
VTFLSPGFLLVAAAAAAATVGLHFLVTRLPPSAPLPTARFVPVAPATVVAVARRPHELWLMLLRVAVVLLVGAAFARPRLDVSRAAERRIVIADRSRAVADIKEVRDSVRRLMGPGDLLLVFDSVARVIPPSDAGDSVAALTRSSARGGLSSALIAARRAAARWRQRGDSLDLDIVSPMTADEVDAATPAIRALWPGRLHIARVAARSDSAAPTRLALRATADDPLRAAVPIRLLADGGDSGGTAGHAASVVRLVRDGATGADSAWVRGGPGRVLIVWPVSGLAPSWTARPTPDTVGAVVALRPAPVAVVAPLGRAAHLDGHGAVHVLAWWVDGEPAAVERRVAMGCIRDVAIAVPSVGDLVLRPEFGRLVAGLVQPCEGAAVGAVPLSAAAVAALTGDGPLAAASRIAGADSGAQPIVPWLLGLSLVLLVVEALVRLDRRPPAAPAMTVGPRR